MICKYEIDNPGNVSLFTTGVVCEAGSLQSKWYNPNKAAARASVSSIIKKNKRMWYHVDLEPEPPLGLNIPFSPVNIPAIIAGKIMMINAMGELIITRRTTIAIPKQTP